MDRGQMRPLLTAREARQKLGSRKSRKQARKLLRWQSKKTSK